MTDWVLYVDKVVVRICFPLDLGFELGKNHSGIRVEHVRKEQSGNLLLFAMTANDSDCGALMSKRWRGSER
jgi:hypothetical protein